MTSLVRVLVTGVAGGTIGEQVCKALRCGHNRYEIVATNQDLSHVAVVRAEHYESLPKADDPEYLSVLMGLIRRYAVQFVIPGSEPELIAMSSHREELADTGAKLLVNSHPVITTCIDKVRTFEFLGNRGFQIPLTREVSDLDSLSHLPDRFPWIVKPAKDSGGSACVFIAQDRDELCFFVSYLLKCGYRTLVQEYVGTASDEYTVGVLHYPDGVLAGSVVIRRQILSGLSNRLRISNQTGRTELGPVLAVSTGISQGELVDSVEIRSQAEAIAGAFGSTGPLNIQGRWNHDHFVPFEINPRFSGTAPMRAMAGFNEPEALISWYLQDVPGPNVVRATRFGIFTRGLVEYFQSRS